MFLKKIKLPLTIASVFLINFLIARPLLANTFTEIMSGFSKTGGNAGYPQGEAGAPKKEFVAAFSTYISGMLTLIGALFMILVIYAGFLWMTARGNEQQTERAKTLIIQATIGLGIVIGARLMVEIVINILGIASGIRGTAATNP
ncbi:MAG: hypothetical protein WC768_04655 [Patescibacteria group bacterium]|jgi:hypothetical protein